MPLIFWFLRKSRSQTQRELADELGTNRGNIVSHEKGNAESNIRHLVRIAKALEVSLERFLKEDLSDF